jgi:Leucine-rich repeat (LRR) protein
LLEKNNDNWISKNLRYAIAKSCNKEPYKITKDYLRTLKEMDLSDRGIYDLAGIQYAINLSNLNLNKNEIVDANLLTALTRLNNLELSENRIEDISFLPSLKRLKSIGLDSNNISKVPNLENLRYLNLINISDNKISDLSFIESLHRKNVKIIASEQLILLKTISIDYGDDITFKTPVRWDKETEVLFDNIQITGKYDYIKTDKRPSLLYSISEILVKNI